MKLVRNSTGMVFPSQNTNHDCNRCREVTDVFMEKENQRRRLGTMFEIEDKADHIYLILSARRLDLLARI